MFEMPLTVNDALRWAALAYILLTVVLGVAATANVLGFRAMRPQYEKRVVGGFLFTLVGAVVGAIVLIFKPSLAAPIVNSDPPRLECGPDKLDAITTPKTLQAALRNDNCRTLAAKWLREAGFYSLSDSSVVVALAEKVPARRADETDFQWVDRARAAIEKDGVLVDLRNRASRQQSPFLAVAVDVDFGFPQQSGLRGGTPGQPPERGEVYVSRTDWNGRLLTVASNAKPECVLRLKAKFALTSARDRPVPLLHLNAVQQFHLLGGPTPESTAAGTVIPAPASEAVYDPARNERCGQRA